MTEQASVIVRDGQPLIRVLLVPGRYILCEHRTVEALAAHGHDLTRLEIR